MEIWDAEFEPERSQRIPPSSDLPALVFSPSFLDLRLVLRSSKEAQAFLVLEAKNLAADVSWKHWIDDDQLIVDDTWFAVDLSTLEELRGKLAAQDISLGVGLKNSQLMWLYWSSDIDVDPLSTTEIGSASSAAGDDFDPTLVSASLYPYQVQGALHLTEMASQGLGVLLADEMGLGKTLQAIYLLADQRKKLNETTLVVCPSALLSNWQREISKFTPALSILVHRGSDRTGDSWHFGNVDIVLTSYDILVRDVALFDSTTWNLVILDEAQAVKNPDSRRSAALRRLSKRVGVAITGTPIENSLKDMWSIFEFVAPDYLGSRTTFERRYPDETEAARALSSKAAPMTIRRKVLDVAKDLPPRIDIRTGVDVNPALGALYESVLAENDTVPLARLTKLRQLCASPESEAVGLGTLQDFPKYAVALDILLEAFAKGEKVLLFASYVDALDTIARDLTDRFPHIFLRVLDGRTSADARQLEIDAFSSHTGPAVLLMNPRATGVGLNIQAASHVVHFTPEWNPAIVAQATARAHRRGQSRPVFVHYLYYVNTVEEAMIDRLDSKRNLQDAGMSRIDGDLSSSDILEALSRSPLRSSHAT
ncbi:MAG: DEAD/DEAH box helicase [Salinibacterium amurskyense]